MTNRARSSEDVTDGPQRGFSRGMNMSVNQVVDHHRPTLAVQRDAAISWHEVIQLGALVSVLGAIAAIALSTIADVSTSAVVLAVIVVGFAASWVRTGRHQL